MEHYKTDKQYMRHDKIAMSNLVIQRTISCDSIYACLNLN